MKRLAIACAGLAGLVLLAPARADDLTGANRLLCSAETASACCEDGQCAGGSAEELNVPQFIEVDLTAKRVSTTKASGNYRSSTPDVKRENGHIVLQGMERGRAYSILIDEKSGTLSAAVATSFGCGVTVFGSCTPLPASK